VVFTVNEKRGVIVHKLILIYGVMFHKFNSEKCKFQGEPNAVGLNLSQGISPAPDGEGDQEGVGIGKLTFYR
jgi:hypothetical protein